MPGTRQYMQALSKFHLSPQQQHSASHCGGKWSRCWALLMSTMVRMCLQYWEHLTVNSLSKMGEHIWASNHEAPVNPEKMTFLTQHSKENTNESNKKHKIKKQGRKYIHTLAEWCMKTKSQNGTCICTMDHQNPVNTTSLIKEWSTNLCKQIKYKCCQMSPVNYWVTERTSSL